jgi:hypothetical protein
LLAAGAAMAAEAPADEAAAAKNYQIHGFASQGYINTDGNNFYGESRGGGSFDYYELGLNGLWQFRERLSVSGQLLAREAGKTDDGDVRVDYLFFDYRFINMDAARAGLRLGRVKNPLGFYNESRDVIFTRPSILLPQSVYLEGTGIREILFSSDGLQLYGDWDHDRHHTAFKMNFAKSDKVSEQTRENFLSGAGSALPGFTVDNMRISDLFFTQVMDEVDGGRMRFALSYVRAKLTADLISTLFPIPPADVSLESDIITLSAQYNQERWSLTSEYSLTSSDFDIAGMSDEGRSEGIYLQGQYRLTPEWTGLLRYDLSYGDRNDRGDSDARDATAGLSWMPKANWIVMGEYHYIHGSNGNAGIPNIDNPGGTTNRTRLLALMLGYRF